MRKKIGKSRKDKKKYKSLQSNWRSWLMNPQTRRIVAINKLGRNLRRSVSKEKGMKGNDNKGYLSRFMNLIFKKRKKYEYFNINFYQLSYYCLFLLIYAQSLPFYSLRTCKFLQHSWYSCRKSFWLAEFLRRLSWFYSSRLDASFSLILFSSVVIVSESGVWFSLSSVLILR